MQAMTRIRSWPAVLLLLLFALELVYLGDDGDDHIKEGWLSAAFAQPLESSVMALGSSWLASNLSYITSPANYFCFGWLQFPANSHQFYSFYVAVWYAGLDNAIVWVANRNNPASSSSTLQLTSDGNLLLISSDSPSAGTGLLWETNTSSRGVLALQLLDSGNVVLQLKNTTAAAVATSYAWQSFSFPTDTLLPSQPLLFNQTLVSRSPSYSTSLASGIFKFYTKQGLASIDHISGSIGSSVATVWQAWQPLVLSGTIMEDSVDIAGELMDSDVFILYNISTGSAYSQLVASDYESAASNSKEPKFRRLTLDPDGNLRMYGWDYASGKWVVLCEAVSNMCNAMSMKGAVAICGEYGVCLDAPLPACACPPGFHPTDEADISSGCSPDELPLPSCAQNSTSGPSSTLYVVLRNTDYPGSDIKNYSPIGLSDCQELCNQACDCVGFIYEPSGSATCWLKKKLTLGYSPQSQPGSRDAYIKLWNFTSSPIVSTPSRNPTLTWMNSSAVWFLPSLQTNSSSCSCTACSPPPIASAPSRQGRLTTVTVSAIAVGELICFVAVLFLLQKANLLDIRIIHRGKHEPSSILEQPGCRAFTYAELVEATENFSKVLGSGGFGEVVRGVLTDGREIAVKTLQGTALQVLAGTHDQFKAEIVTLGRIHHANLVRLYGYCTEDSHRMLVYEFMENGSMNRFLFDSQNDGATEPDAAAVMGGREPPWLSWKTRYKICRGTAKGLAYLHEDCLDCIVHCDIKPENILLDKDFEPKVGDFGVAYLFGRNETLETTTIRGTRGYLAPEWLAYLPITAKADVFSYGMVLIEIVSGCRNFRVNHGMQALHDGAEAVLMSPSWVLNQVQSGHVEEVVDPRIRRQVDLAEVEKVLRIAFLCLHEEASARPTMRSIVQMLEGSVDVPTLSSQGRGSLYDQVQSGVVDSSLQHNYIVQPAADGRLQSPHEWSTSTAASGFSNLLSGR